jgi:hypothetical protein
VFGEFAPPFRYEGGSLSLSLEMREGHYQYLRDLAGERVEKAISAGLNRLLVHPVDVDESVIREKDPVRFAVEAAVRKAKAGGVQEASDAPQAGSPVPPVCAGASRSLQGTGEPGKAPGGPPCNSHPLSVRRAISYQNQ